MNNKRALIFLLLLFLGIIGGATYLYRSLASGWQSNFFLLRNETESAEDSPSDEAQASSPAEEAEGAPQGSGETPSDAAEGSQEAAASQEADNAGKGSAASEAAPDFTVYDGDGNAVKLSDYAGKPIVLNFWASWCGPCKSEMPGFDNLYQKYGSDIQFLMVNLTDGYQETQETAQSFIDEEGYAFPVFFDTESTAAIAYAVSSIPATYLINEEGELVAYALSAVSEEVLENAIIMLQE